MKGIYYNRHCGENRNNHQRDDWYKPTEGESIILNRQAFSNFFPEVAIQGEIKWRCDNHSNERCEGCNGCGQSVKITFGQIGQNRQRFTQRFTASHTDEVQTHNVGEFMWDWSGQGATEHWFDNEAICLRSTGDYRSRSGLTASCWRIVAYKRHVEVRSFRRGNRGNKDDYELEARGGIIWAEFVNRPTQYRANWTGFGMGRLDLDDDDTKGGSSTRATPPVFVVGDALDNLIETMLSGQVGQETVCRHNRNVRTHIVTEKLNKTPFLLCKSCRLRGVRWEEFTTRNRADTCPYFRRACKSVVEKSDSFPDWFAWSGDNLLSAQRRLQDGESEAEAYEVTYVRRKEGFVRRSVLLLNNRTREVWMFRYNGFIPRTYAEFKIKYAVGRQISGYMGTGPSNGYSENPNDRFLSEAKIAAAVAQGFEQPLWQNTAALISIDLGRDDLHDFAIQKGEVNGFQITQIDYKGKERDDLEAKKNPAPFYSDAGASYYLVFSDWRYHTVIRRRGGGGEELYRSDRGNHNKWFLLRLRTTTKK